MNAPTTVKPHLVIVGHGMASQRLLQTLSTLDHGWSISVFGAERESAYNRILLSPYLAGETSAEALPLADHDWYAANGIRLFPGKQVAAVDRSAKTLTTNTGRKMTYDRLVIATGSRPAMPDVPGNHLAGITGFRSLADTHWLMTAADNGQHAVVIGGGFLGLEAAEGLRKRGLSVTLVHRSKYLLNRNLDADAGHLLTQTLKRRGLSIHLEAQLDRFLGDEQVTGVMLNDGTRLTADLVVVAAGIRPNREIGEQAGLDCDRGIRVDHTLTTSDPDIHALGECCQLGQTTFGLVDPINQQADVLARRLAGETPGYELGEAATRLKISGIQIFSCGEINAGPDTDCIVYHDHTRQEYRRILLRDNRLVGAVLYGDTRSGPWLFEHLKQQSDLSPMRAQLAFGEAHC